LPLWNKLLPLLPKTPDSHTTNLPDPHPLPSLHMSIYSELKPVFDTPYPDSLSSPSSFTISSGNTINLGGLTLLA